MSIFGNEDESGLAIVEYEYFYDNFYLAAWFIEHSCNLLLYQKRFLIIHPSQKISPEPSHMLSRRITAFLPDICWTKAGEHFYKISQPGISRGAALQVVNTANDHTTEIDQ